MYYCNYVFSAVRKVAEGHRLVSEVWTLFEHTCEVVGPGELPQLLRQLNGTTTPTPAPEPSPVKTEPMEEEGEVKPVADPGMSGFHRDAHYDQIRAPRIYIQVWELRHCPKDKTCNRCTHP